MEEYFSALWRGIRVALALTAGFFLGGLLEIPELMLITPVLSAGFKLLREKFPKLWWIPL